MPDLRFIDIKQLDEQPSLERHPLNQYPQMRGDEFEALKADIAANKLRQPPILCGGLVIDGDARVRACAELGIVITRFGVYDGDRPAELVNSLNAHRRYLSHGQRVMAAALTLQKAGRRQNRRWMRGSVDNSLSSDKSAWQSAMAKAGVILDFGGAVLADLVVTDLWTLDKAYRHADALRRVKPERSAEAKAEYAAAFKAYSQCEAECEAKAAELEKLGEALGAAAADAVSEEQKTQARDKKSAELESPVTERAKAIGALASYGRAGDPNAEGFNPADFDPPMLADNFEPEVLADAMRGLQKLIDWRARYDAETAA
jgi:hypothetical protein